MICGNVVGDSLHRRITFRAEESEGWRRIELRRNPVTIVHRDGILPVEIRNGGSHFTIWQDYRNRLTNKIWA